MEECKNIDFLAYCVPQRPFYGYGVIFETPYNKIEIKIKIPALPLKSTLVFIE